MGAPVSSRNVVLLSGPPGPRATRTASEPSSEAIVAPVRLISGQNPDTENRRDSAARPPVSSVPVSMQEMALKWNSGSGLHTTSSGVRAQDEMIWRAMDRW